MKEESEKPPAARDTPTPTPPTMSTVPKPKPSAIIGQQSAVQPPSHLAEPSAPVGRSPITGKPRSVIKFDWPFPNFKQAQRSWKIKSSATIFLVGMFGRTVMHLMNKTKIYNEDRMRDAIFKRPAGTPLITYSNHESCMDDPMLLSIFFRSSQIIKFDRIRWSLAAHDICFDEPLHAKFFSLGKCIPIIRGQGVYQRGVDFIIDRLNHAGDWLHIFPEGGINLERKELRRIKWGVGRIISECKKAPIVIPFWHTGMADVLPNKEPYYPRFGNKVLVNVGQPLKLEDILKSVEKLPPMQKRKIITDFLEHELRKLREETLKLRHDLSKS
jgi:monolysocardiolipin acyltransferase